MRKRYACSLSGKLLVGSFQKRPIDSHQVSHLRQQKRTHLPRDLVFDEFLAFIFIKAIFSSSLYFIECSFPEIRASWILFAGSCVRNSCLLCFQMGLLMMGFHTTGLFNPHLQLPDQENKANQRFRDMRVQSLCDFCEPASVHQKHFLSRENPERKQNSPPVHIPCQLPKIYFFCSYIYHTQNQGQY